MENLTLSLVFDEEIDREGFPEKFPWRDISVIPSKGEVLHIHHRGNLKTFEVVAIHREIGGSDFRAATIDSLSGNGMITIIASERS